MLVVQLFLMIRLIQTENKDLDVYYLPQSYFDIPKRTIRSKSNIIILFQQSLKDVEHVYRDIPGFDMFYDEFNGLC